MLKIKLARFGKKNQPHYRIVINEARDRRDGKYIALVGNYSPASQPKVLKIDAEAYQSWVKRGAQPTETVAELFKRFQSKEPFPVRAKQPSRKQVAKNQAAAEEKAAAQETKEVKETQPVAAETAAQPVPAPAPSADQAETAAAN